MTFDKDFNEINCQYIKLEGKNYNFFWTENVVIII